MKPWSMRFPWICGVLLEALVGVVVVGALVVVVVVVVGACEVTGMLPEVTVTSYSYLALLPEAPTRALRVGVAVGWLALGCFRSALCLHCVLG